MTTIEPENKEIQAQYQADKKNVDDFLAHKTANFSAAALKRLVLSELSYNRAFKYKKFCGFTREQIRRIIEYPERYGSALIKLSQFMMRKSGYYKRLIEYFVNMGVIRWTVDTVVNDNGFFNVSEKTLRSNYIKYVAQCNKFDIENRITDILRKLFVEDICYAFVTENDVESSIFILDSDYCEIQRLTNGSVYQFAINRSLLNTDYIKTLPEELKQIINDSYNIQENNMVMIPYENSLCLKYNNDYIYPYPPFFSLIAGILDIDIYSDLAKAKTEADAYKLVYFKIPTNEDGNISMGDEIVVPFVEMCKNIIPDSWGCVPAPMELSLIESKSTQTQDTNKVAEAVDNYYGEAGVSKALVSSASSGSELKMSIKVDSADLYRIYRQIESWMDLQLKLRGHIYKSYGFKYNILNLTLFDIDDAVDRELKLAQASLPNKMRLLATSGMNPAVILGNTVMENKIFADVIDMWQPLKSSYTTSGDESEGGRPTMDETEISDVTDTQRQNDSNKTENRV